MEARCLEARLREIALQNNRDAATDLWRFPTRNNRTVRDVIDELPEFHDGPASTWPGSRDPQTPVWNIPPIAMKVSLSNLNALSLSRFRLTTCYIREDHFGEAIKVCCQIGLATARHSHQRVAEAVGVSGGMAAENDRARRGVQAVRAEGRGGERHGDEEICPAENPVPRLLSAFVRQEPVWHDKGDNPSRPRELERSL